MFNRQILLIFLKISVAMQLQNTTKIGTRNTETYLDPAAKCRHTELLIKTVHCNQVIYHANLDHRHFI